jgi:hypothetical protein
MHQHSLKRLLSVSLLAGGLAFVGPIQVQAAPVAGPQAVWQWLTGAWEEAVPVLWGRPGAGRGDGLQEKGGPCIDPNGAGTPHSTAPSAGPVCHAWTEGGPCIDPNG